MKESYINGFNPKGLMFYFNFCNDGFCYKTRHGICSLDLSEDEVQLIPVEEYPSDDNVNHCRNIYKSITESGQKYPIDINRNLCEHFTFYDGQHRVCIASNKGLKLIVHIVESNEICHVCREENEINKALSYAEILVKETTPRRTLFHTIFRIEPQSYFQSSLDKWKEKMSKFQIAKEKNYRKF